jgi:ribosome maturation factor RimP
MAISSYPPEGRLMTEYGITEKLAAIIKPILDQEGLELVEIQFRGEQHGQVLRIIIDSDQGIGINNCSRVSKQVSYLLDVEDIISQAYHLEVTSPGLDRPLTSSRDFERNIGKKIVIRHWKNEEKNKVTGIIDKVTDDFIVLKIDKTQLEIQFSALIKAKLVIEF